MGIRCTKAIFAHPTKEMHSFSAKNFGDALKEKKSFQQKFQPRFEKKGFEQKNMQKKHFNIF